MPLPRWAKLILFHPDRWKTRTLPACLNAHLAHPCVLLRQGWTTEEVNEAVVTWEWMNDREPGE